MDLSFGKIFIFWSSVSCDEYGVDGFLVACVVVGVSVGNRDVRNICVGTFYGQLL